MNVVSDIFNEYVNMRSSGLPVNDTLQHLRPFIDALPKIQKQELGGYVRSWEKTTGINITATQTQPAPKVDPKTQKAGIKSLRNDDNGEKVSVASSTIKPLADNPEISQKAEWITCANCNRKNRIDTIFCYSCGHMLEQTKGKYGTRQFSGATSEMFDPHHFDEDSVLVMRIRDLDYDYELRPQVNNHEMVVGRSTANSAMSPDVDLSACNAERLGVSRLHLAVRFDKSNNTIHIYDLGSANGTFVNGQKLHPKEIRILRDGDEVRLGRLVTRMMYFHPGEEIQG